MRNLLAYYCLSSQEAEEEHENSRITDLDEVTIVVTGDDERQPPSPPAPKPDVGSMDSAAHPTPPPSAVTTITINKPTPKPRNLGNTDSSSQGAGLQPQPTPTDSSGAHHQASPGDPRRDPPASQPTGPSSLPAAAAATKNAPGPRPAPQPQQLSHPGASGERRQSGSTLSDLKKHRSNSRENLVDAAVQNMFLESVQSGRQQRSNNSSSAVQGNSMPMGPRDKAKNGHNNNNNAVSYSASDGQLRRFVAPNHSPVVGDDEKPNCCVIL